MNIVVKTEEKKAKRSLMGPFKLFFKGEFFQGKINVWLSILGLLANIANWLMIFIFLRPATENIILHYNVYFGVDMTGSKKLAFFLPAIGLVIFIINFLLAYNFYRNKERIAGYVLLLSGVMAQLALIIAALSVIIINY